MHEKSYDDLLLYAMKVVREVQKAEANLKRHSIVDEIQVVIVEPSKRPYKKMIPNTLEAMKSIVGGYIENHTFDITPRGAHISFVCNEEGERLQLPFNRHIIDFGFIVGTLFITAYNYDGDNISLTDQECDQYIRRFANTEIYL